MATAVADACRERGIRWAVKPVEVQRQIASLILSPDVLGEVRIMRVADSPPDAPVDRVKWAVTEA